MYPQTDHKSTIKFDLFPQPEYKRGRQQEEPMAKSEFMKIRVSEKEKEAFSESAALSGISLSAWIRERCRRAAVRELEDASRPVPFIEPIVR